MSSRRVLKAAEAIREVVSTAILLELRDPRIQDVTVTRVAMSGDMRLAKVYVSVMGDEAKQQTCLWGLQRARGFLQSKVGKRIQTRYIPQLEFVLDQGVKRSLAVAEILRQVLPPAADSLDETDEADVADPADEPVDEAPAPTDHRSDSS